MNILDRIEIIGNRLPHPASLFFIGTVVVFILSALAAMTGWNVTGPQGNILTATNLLSSAGIWWLLSTMVDNFMQFPPLGIVLTGMLGIGMAEHSGLLPALLKEITRRIPPQLLTPAILFIGIMSSLGLDAGYVVLPPIAAALYASANRSPLVGIAVAFAGVSAGFSANLSITAVDPLLAGFTQSAADIIAPGYTMAVTANWWFMIASTLLLTAIGWLVTARWVEPRLHIATTTPENPAVNAEPAHPAFSKPLLLAMFTFFATLVVVCMMIYLPGAPLYGTGEQYKRWIEVTVPLLLLVFIIPGITYGIAAGTIKNDRDLAGIMGRTLSDLGPYIVLAFFAAQFIAAFSYSGLGEILAITGGQFLAAMDLSAPVLLCGFIILVFITNLFVGSASAKYAFLAPVFVPMLMQVGFSPELTQAAYRVGDSTSNVITPLNPYMVIILAVLQKHVKNAGIGTLVSVMLPYAIIFTLVWSILLVIWYISGIPLGPGGNLHFNF